eukprot:Skav207746  [mRNA]  locus=scaffold362:500483:504226:- [translate_table: standard]
MWIFRQIRAMGYEIKYSGVVDITRTAATTRPRWLCLAMRTQDGASDHPSFVQGHPSRPITLADMKCIMPWNDTMLETLLVPPEAIELAKQHALLPDHMKSRVFGDGPQVLMSRCYGDDQALPTVMARYGFQHQLSQRQLVQGGLLCHFYRSSTGCIRFLHPIELAMVHCNWGHIIVSADYAIAWVHQGNQISPAHALLLLSNAVAMITGNRNLEIPRILEAFFADRTTRDNSFFLNLGSLHALMRTDFTQHPKAKEANWNQLLRACTDPSLIRDMGWTPTDGLFPLDLWDLYLRHQDIPIPAALRMTPQDPEPPASVVTDPSVSAEPSTTYPFTPVLQGQLITRNGPLDFWFAADVPIHTVLSFWNDWYQVDPAFQQDNSTGIALRLIANPNPQSHDGQVIKAIVQYQEQALTIHNQTDANIARFCYPNSPWKDQFDECSPYNVHPGLVFMPCELPTATVGARAAFVLAALHQCHITHAKDFVSHMLVYTCTGPEVAVSTILDVWGQMYPREFFHAMGYELEFTSTATKGQMVLKPLHTTCPFHFGAVHTAIVVKLFRFLMQDLHDDTGLQVVITWQGRKLWTGALPQSLQVAAFSSLLRIASGAIAYNSEYRMIHRGKVAQPETQLHELISHVTPMKFHAVLQLRGGGNGTKQAVQTQNRNSLASILLHEGYELSWVSMVIEKVMQHVPLKEITPVTSLTHGQDRLKQTLQLIQQTGESIPNVQSKKTSQASHAAKQRRKGPGMPHPQDYAVQDGFLVAADGTTAQPLTEVDAKKSGYVMVDFENCLPWLRMNETISSDELALVLLGEIPGHVTTQLVHESCAIPCIDPQERCVLIKCTIIQLGQRHIKPMKLDAHTIAHDPTTLVSITLWKTDWLQSWDQITRSPYAFVKQQPGCGELLNIWGKSFRSGKTATTPADSQSLQVHATLKDTALLSFLHKSGLNGLWAVPKTTQGAICSSWKTIWLSTTMDLGQIKVLSATIPGYAGLVRSKNRYAVRVHKSDYAKAWKALYPDEAVPDSIDIVRTFKVEHLPFGTTSAAMSSWLTHVGWTARPLRAVGPRAWIVGGPAGPPAGQLAFNASPVLIKELTGNSPATSHPIVAGPKTCKRATGLAPLQGDPWAAWEGPRIQPQQSAAPRQLEGPIEAKFQSQETKFTQIEQAITQLQADHVKQQATLAQVQAEAQHREEQSKQYLEQRFNEFRQEMSQGVTQAIQAQTTKFDTSLLEIKRLIIDSSKRKTPEEGDDEMR